MSDRLHGIERAEWERRFARAIELRANIAGSTLAEVVAAELQSWPVDGEGESPPDWMENTPEEAAASNLSYWEDEHE